MDKKQTKKEFQEGCKVLRALFKSYDFMPGAPADEFDALFHQVLSHLYKGYDAREITVVLQEELTGRYGISPEPQEVEAITREIIHWWKNTRSGEH